MILSVQQNRWELRREYAAFSWIYPIVETHEIHGEDSIEDRLSVSANMEKFVTKQETQSDSEKSQM